MFFNLLLIVGSVSLNVGAQILIKKAMQGLGKLNLCFEHLWQLCLSVGTNAYLLLAMGAYALSLVLWMVTLSRVNLSLAYPFQSLGYVLTAVAGFYFFHEPLSPLKLFAIGIIMVGVLLLVLSGEL